MRWPSAESLWRPAGAALPPLVRTPRRPPRPVGRSGASPIMLAAAVLLLGLGGLLAYLLLPEETVVLYPIGRPIDEALEIRADPALPDVDPARARVPARIGYVVVDVVEQAQTLGRLPAPDARAVGSVTFANRQGGAATVPAGTFLLTASGARFATQAEATLDAAAGSTARVGVQAIEPGEPGNVGRLEINRIVG